ncbi:MAG: hypothetical protein U1A04_00760, partial [Moraxellaceae bacterium]|nr:hypothetical protein [Moraxellaceae bacterium]
MTHKNLVLIPDIEHHDIGDFIAIAELIRDKTNDVIPYVFSHKEWRKSYFLKLRLTTHPTLVVAMRAFGKSIHPIKGCCHQGLDLSKSETYSRMESAGLTVTPWCNWNRDTHTKSWMDNFVISK